MKVYRVQGFNLRFRVRGLGFQSLPVAQKTYLFKERCLETFKSMWKNGCIFWCRAVILPTFGGLGKP